MTDNSLAHSIRVTSKMTMAKIGPALMAQYSVVLGGSRIDWEAVRRTRVRLPRWKPAKEQKEVKESKARGGKGATPKRKKPEAMSYLDLEAAESDDEGDDEDGWEKLPDQDQEERDMIAAADEAEERAKRGKSKTSSSGSSGGVVKKRKVVIVPDGDASEEEDPVAARGAFDGLDRWDTNGCPLKPLFDMMRLAREMIPDPATVTSQVKKMWRNRKGRDLDKKQLRAFSMETIEMLSLIGSIWHPDMTFD